MRIFFLCNNWLGWQALKWLRQQGEEIVGLSVHPAARAKFADKIRAEVSGNCAVFDGARLKEELALEQVRSLKADIGVSVLFAYILSSDFINIFPRGCINLHQIGRAH